MLASPSLLETIMRMFPVAAALALTALTLSASLQAQRPDDQIDARSLQLLSQGDAARAAGNLDAATDAYETALAVDPRNRAAFIALGGVAKARGLNGKAIRLYREALTIEPNDVRALGGQGEALVAKGAVVRARENLTKIQAICAKGCAEATRLAGVIAKGPPAALLTSQAVAPKPSGDQQTP